MFPRKGRQPIVGNSFYPKYFSSKFLPDFMNIICRKKLFVCKPTNYKTGTS